MSVVININRQRTTLVSHLSTPRSACASVTDADGTRLAYSTIGGDLAMLEFQRILLCHESALNRRFFAEDVLFRLFEWL